MKLNMWRLEQKIMLFTYRMIAVACLTAPAFAQNVSATALTTENQQKIELAVWKYAIDTPLLLSTIDWFRDLTRNSRESAAIAELSRLEFMRAQLELDSNRRIQLFENCIAIADQSLALNANDVRGLFWKAAAMGKMAESSGIVSALRMIGPMEKMLLKVVALDEQYENAGAHRALGRIYHKLPGFPISFGSNQKALMHMKRAHELFPRDVITRAFYAELLYDVGRKEEARKHANFVLATPIADEDALEFSEYVDIALDVIKKTGGSEFRVGNY
ncbi:TRAP transporter TatT component family protein [Nitrosomonas sp. Is35]|uniref:TRAP transporter TatT component family protein n=1 Tax=unclassified Nitrosomonas TaxID=2609265 RepID=UPI00294B39D9|nr:MULTISPECIES: TRAP transporter TatT component family protein [unclassified Nitrosomonas]MDV6340317.1 TRAP transporter TatT component family protein [Nitrosomonas sp. Is24]MDV6346078.1 TRAP transporter TatT component family protein [Nitrosomonas sp. Is35]